MDFFPPSAPVWSAIFAFGSATAAVATYVIHRRNLAAKFVDRLYELDKIVISNPLSFQRFVNAKKWNDDALVGREALTAGEYFKARSIAYFLLNLYDEVCVAYGGLEGEIEPTGRWLAWRTFILTGAKHPLITQLIEDQCIVTCKRGVKALVSPKSASVFHPALLAFLCAVQNEWYGLPFEKDAFW